MNKKHTPQSEITPEEKELLQDFLPRPPKNASDDEKRRFQAIVGKIKPAWHGELGRWYNDYSELTEAEHFTIGNTGTKEWPFFVPQEAKAVLEAMRPRREMESLTVIMPITDNNPDLAAAHERAREVLRKLTPVIEHGKRNSEGQKAKAKKPRKIKNEAGNTLDDVVTSLAEAHHDETPLVIWPHLKTAISEWSGSDCFEIKPDENKRDSWLYQFTKLDGSADTISYQSFRKKLKAPRLKK